MKTPSPGIYYREKLRTALAAAGVDTGVLLRQLDAEQHPRSQLIYFLHSACFSHPEELARSGYPDDWIKKAERVAERQVEISFEAIMGIVNGLPSPPQPVAVKPEPSAVPDPTPEPSAH